MVTTPWPVEGALDLVPTTTTHDIDCSTAEAFAAIPLAAICCDRHFRPEEAKVIRSQPLSRSPLRSMEPYAFGVLFSDLLR